MRFRIHPATTPQPLPAPLDAEAWSRCCPDRCACDLPIVLGFRGVPPINKILPILIPAFAAATTFAKTPAPPADPQPHPAQAAPAPAPAPPPDAKAKPDQ